MEINVFTTLLLVLAVDIGLRVELRKGEPSSDHIVTRRTVVRSLHAMHMAWRGTDIKNKAGPANNLDCLLAEEPEHDGRLLLTAREKLVFNTLANKKDNAMLDRPPCRSCTPVTSPGASSSYTKRSIWCMNWLVFTGWWSWTKPIQSTCIWCEWCQSDIYKRKNMDFTPESEFVLLRCLCQTLASPSLILRH